MHGGVRDRMGEGEAILGSGLPVEGDGHVPDDRGILGRDQGGFSERMELG